MEPIEELIRKVNTDNLKSSWIFIRARKPWLYLLLGFYALQTIAALFGGLFLLYLGYANSNSIVLMFVGGFLLVVAIAGAFKLYSYLSISMWGGYLLVTDESVLIKRGFKQKLYSFKQLAHLRLVIDRGIYQSITFLDQSNGLEECLINDRVFGAPQDLLPMIKTKIN